MPTDERHPTVSSVMNQACRELREAGVESPRLTAELLVAHVLGWERVRVLAHGEETLTRAAADTIAALVRRRSASVPLQHLTGRQEFFGLDFEVGPDVLVPRPETEILVEKALQLSHSVAPGPLVFADVGTGSGCIAISVAYALPGARGWGIDISAAALAVARRNAARHGVAARVGLLQSDLLERFAVGPVFDLLLSNPPYVALADAEALSPEVRQHEPHLALFAGECGLDVYERLVPQAAACLRPGGALLLELGIGMHETVSGLVERAGLHVDEVADDLRGIPRCVIARRAHG
jgi:release factor glutamine methyltransferase